MKVDEMIDSYISLRDKKAELVAKQKLEVGKIDNVLDKIEAALLAMFNESGGTSIKTEAGTAFVSTKASAVVADWDVYFKQFVLPNQAWEFLEKRCSKLAVEQYRAAHDDLPPGINWSEIKTVNVRRS